MGIGNVVICRPPGGLNITLALLTRREGKNKDTKTVFSARNCEEIAKNAMQKT